MTPCATHLDLYLPRCSRSRPSVRRPNRSSCATCPLLADCLYKAVVQIDVSGYVGCTTPRERRAIRKLIGVKIESEDFDSLAGARGERQPVDHEDVLRARSQHPDDSLEALAARLDCSLSTVKRHLRRARRLSGTPQPPQLREIRSRRAEGASRFPSIARIGASGCGDWRLGGVAVRA